MDMQNHNEHISCINYNKDPEPAIQSCRFPYGAGFRRSISQNSIVILLSGNLTFSSEKAGKYEVTKGQIVLFLSGMDFDFVISEETYMILFRLKEVIRFCERVSLEKLCREIPAGKETFYSLPVKKRIYDYLNGFISYLDKEFSCAEYLQLKLRELSLILCMEYKKEELSRFFAPVFSKHAHFVEFVLSNYRKVKTLQALAELSHYSKSGFEKQFKKVFGISAYQWMNAQRAKLVYHEINHSGKPIKEICDENGFASLSHFNDFCYKYYGKSPGKIRNEII